MEFFSTANPFYEGVEGITSRYFNYKNKVESSNDTDLLREILRTLSQYYEETDQATRYFFYSYYLSISVLLISIY